MNIILLLPNRPVSIEGLMAEQALTQIFEGNEVQIVFAEEPLTDIFFHALEQSTLVAFGEALFTPESIRWVSALLLRNLRWVPLCLTAQPGQTELSPPLRELLHHFAESDGAISVGNRETQTLLDGTFEKTVSLLTPSLFALNSTLPFLECEGRTVFQASSWHPGRRCSPKQFSRWSKKAYQALEELRPALFLANEKESLDLGARPGVYTLYEPLFPQVHAKCLASADRVVTLSESTLAFTLPKRVRTVVLTDEPRKDEIWNAPTLTLKEAENPTTYAKKLEAIFRNYPWDKIEAHIAGHRERLSRYLKSHGLAGSRSEASIPQPTESSPLTLCVTADKSYLPSLLGLLENLSALESGPVEWYVLALDAEVEAFLETHYRELSLRILTLESLWGEQKVQAIRKRPVAEQAYLSKARFSREVLRTVQRPVFYLDADLFFFQSPKHLLNEFVDKAVLLFPHWNDRYDYTKRCGQFNTGLFCVRPEGEAFLTWWDALCEIDCDEAPERGLFYEQGYLDLAPLHFDSVQIYRRGDHNVGPWAVATLGMACDPKAPGVLINRLGKPIESYHSAQTTPQGFAGVKSAWDQSVLFFSASDRPERFHRLLRQVLHAQKRSWPIVGKLCHAEHTFKNRTAWKSFRYTHRSVAWLTSPFGQRLVQLAGLLYGLARAFYRRFKPPKPDLGAEAKRASWLALQQTRWLALNTPVIGPEPRMPKTTEARWPRHDEALSPHRSEPLH